MQAHTWKHAEWKCIQNAAPEKNNRPTCRYMHKATCLSQSYDGQSQRFKDRTIRCKDAAC